MPHKIIPLPGAKRSWIYLLPGFQRDPRVPIMWRRADQRMFSRSLGDWWYMSLLNECLHIVVWEEVASNHPYILSILSISSPWENSCLPFPAVPAMHLPFFLPEKPGKWLRVWACSVLLETCLESWAKASDRIFAMTSVGEMRSEFSLVMKLLSGPCEA